MAELAEIKTLLSGNTSSATAPWLNSDEACRMLRCSPSKLARLRAEGEIKHTGQGTKGQTILHNRKSIEMYLDRQSKRNLLIR